MADDYCMLVDADLACLKRGASEQIPTPLRPPGRL
jgi:hypothetical protein